VKCDLWADIRNLEFRLRMGFVIRAAETEYVGRSRTITV